MAKEPNEERWFVIESQEARRRALEVIADDLIPSEHQGDYGKKVIAKIIEVTVKREEAPPGFDGTPDFKDAVTKFDSIRGKLAEIFGVTGQTFDQAHLPICEKWLDVVLKIVEEEFPMHHATIAVFKTRGLVVPIQASLKHITGYFVDESNGRLDERAFIAFIRDYLLVKTFEIPDPTPGQ